MPNAMRPPSPRWAQHPAARVLLCVLVLVLAACGSDPAGPRAQPLPDAAPADARSFIAVDDPWEGLNRRLYKFNAQADRWVLVPVVDAYTEVVPSVLRDRVSDFFANIGNLVTFANEVLQLKFADAGKTALRFGFNTMFGMFGLVDIASAAGMPQYKEDFGQTMGLWGLDAGPYVMLPILGPSNVRDAGGTAADAAAMALIDPFGISSFQSDNPPVLVAGGVNARYRQSFRYHQSGSPFEYDLVRFLYTKKRAIEIGNHPFSRDASARSDP